jgi:hypothetical protein
LRGFNFREKLEEKNKRSRKCFEFLNKRCKTKKSGGAKCKKHRHISKRIKIPGGAPAPPHYYAAPPLTSIPSPISNLPFFDQKNKISF